MPAGDSHGFWAPGDGTLREFDEQFNCGPERPNSRSRRIIEAMRLLTDVYQIFDDQDFEPKDERHASRVVRMAVAASFDRSDDT